MSKSQLKRLEVQKVDHNVALEDAKKSVAYKTEYSNLAAAYLDLTEQLAISKGNYQNMTARRDLLTEKLADLRAKAQASLDGRSHRDFMPADAALRQILEE
jgi:hypothetical protein